MDMSRSIKRLALIVLFAIIVILVSKSLLSKAAKNLSIEVEKKQQAKARKTPAILPESAPQGEISSTAEISYPNEAVIQSSPLAVETTPAAQ
jgi:hypothetical protein